MNKNKYYYNEAIKYIKSQGLSCDECQYDYAEYINDMLDDMVVGQDENGEDFYTKEVLDKIISKAKDFIEENQDEILDEVYEDDDYAGFEYKITNNKIKPRDEWEELNWLEFDEDYSYGKGKRYHAEGKDWYFNIYELEDGTWNLIVDYDYEECEELDDIFTSLEKAKEKANEIYNTNWNMYEESLTEGCWSCPNTIKKARELVKLLSQPLPAGEAEDKLYNLIGDDNLFDDIDDYIEEQGPDYDVSYYVKAWILKNIIYEEDVEWRVPFSDEVLKILKNMIKKDPIFKNELD